MPTTLRAITVDGVRYHWWIRDDAIDAAPDRHICISTSKTGQQLRLDPYPWAQEIRPAIIADAIRFGLAHGWNPATAGAPIFCGLHAGALHVLPEGVQFVHQLPGS
jgi:hypothetical protein